MKILLIDPPFKRFTGLVNNYYPIGLGYIASVTKEIGHTVKIYEADAAKRPTSLDFVGEYQRYDSYLQGVNDRENPIWHEIRQLLREYRPDLVGIGSITPKIASALVVADLAKEYNPNCFVVIGGAHPTVSPDQTIRCPSVDFIVRGEGEKTFAELLSTLDSASKSYNQIKGMSYKENGKIFHNPPREYARDLNSIPFPAREELMNPGNYTSEDMGVLLTSRGCPFKCTYCYHPWKGKVNFRSIDNVIEEIKGVMRDFGTRQFAIKDDTFNVSSRHTQEFCERVLKEGLDINWDCTTRVDRIDEDTLKLMVRAGCNVIKVGIETGSQKILEQTHKGTTLEQARKSAELFNRHGIFWTAYFMLGLPQETEEDIWATYKFMKEINPFYAGLGVYEPFKFTELFDIGVKLGLLHPEVELEHFYKTRPKDYYFINPKRRVAEIPSERFETLAEYMTRAFDSHNKSFGKMIRRGLARRKAYLSDFSLLFGDCKKALNWAMGW
jgi:radical SAM superfamily enzyme YgiQ (UPF0313 family)